MYTERLVRKKTWKSLLTHKWTRVLFVPNVTTTKPILKHTNNLHHKCKPAGHLLGTLCGHTSSYTIVLRLTLSWHIVRHKFPSPNWNVLFPNSLLYHKLILYLVYKRNFLDETSLKFVFTVYFFIYKSLDCHIQAV